MALQRSRHNGAGRFVPDRGRAYYDCPPCRVARLRRRDVQTGLSGVSTADCHSEGMSGGPGPETNEQRLARLQQGLAAIQAEWRSYFAILLAAPDHSTRVLWTCQRFNVDEEVAMVALDQPVSLLIKS